MAVTSLLSRTVTVWREKVSHAFAFFATIPMDTHQPPLTLHLTSILNHPPIYLLHPHPSTPSYPPHTGAQLVFFDAWGNRTAPGAGHVWRVTDGQGYETEATSSGIVKLDGESTH